MSRILTTRRRLLQTAGAGLTLAAAGGLARPALAVGGRPVITHGIQSGDITANSAVVWSRADRAARMMVEVAATEDFHNARLIRGPHALANSDYTAKMVVTGLEPGQDVFYRVRFAGLDSDKATSEPMVGRIRTAPMAKRDITFVWSGDTCGQGWGINTEWGGMRGYKAMLDQNPDFFLNNGDCIYADGPIKPEVTLKDGSIWKNVTTEEKSKVAETLAEFRGNYKYNLMDTNVRALLAQVPVIAQWDDHETLNNWYPNEILADDRYTEKSVALLSARANQAFHEFMPTNPSLVEPGRVYRKISYGPLLDVFVLDMRSYRGDNSPNRQPTRSSATDFLGREQLQWLKRELATSKATWKVMAADMPIGILVRDGKTAFENGSNGDGPVLGREFDIAELLSFLKAANIRNTVWLTTDVHYTAAHYYNPNKAQFQDFLPFWEFVSGPIHAGSFGPGAMDNTFGPEVKFSKDPGGVANLPPSEGLQFYGRIDIAADSGVMTVDLRDIANTSLFKVDLSPET
ncbi:MAG: alkaline phosphatase D family protein [Alphaproteobacteria bacterium]|nr:alkaline phosphatase D family protein [Alphaproteobacteria bacterium]MCB9949293.1 alkaline phosphatase D family protein [Rhodospirillaceae bacterium]